MNRSSISPHRLTTGLLLLVAVFFLHVVPVWAADEVSIIIGGDVYGGGKNGAVGTSFNATHYTQAEADAENALHLVNDAEDRAPGTTGYVTTYAEGYTPVTTSDIKDAPEVNAVKLTNDVPTANVTTVTINGGTMRTVFGGGENGRTYGSTSITVDEKVSTIPTTIGGIVNGINWTSTIHGGLFGAGDGPHAYVFGNSSVLIEGGTLYQNVYGGGNRANLMGKTSVTLQGGNLHGSVFGGARMADIYGYSFVDIDGANIKSNLILDDVYGGNDISGNITSSEQWAWTSNIELPTSLTSANANGINNTWNAFVHSSAEAANSGKHIFVGQLFGGGNGDYDDSAYETGGSLTMTDTPAQGSTQATNASFTDLNKPEVDKVYLELNGGTFGYVYGGGNKATVTVETDICLNNTSTVSTPSLSDQLTDDRLTEMGLNPHYFHNDMQFNRVFGGNNKADMSIRPTWHLIQGSIDELFSGGNKGKMTSPTGILLNIQSASMTVENVYGGCRMADVDPSESHGSGSIPAENYPDGMPSGITGGFQADHAARVLVTAGTIQNVYGGNDVSGTVYFGTDLEIFSSITGEVYGGGNGSYIYTDNEDLASHVTYDDLYYGDGTTMSAENSVAALDAFRPQTVKSYVHVAGTSNDPRTVIGTVYGGGNSATVSGTNKGDIHLQLGEYVTIENVFLGSNGAQMSNPTETLAKYTSGTETVGDNEEDISQIDLTDSDILATYMQGAAVACMPTYGFDAGYYATQDESKLARIGSFFGGGNVGSMTSSSLFTIAFNKPIILTKKLVGGCNQATVSETADICAENVGGFTGGDGTSDKINIDVSGVIFDVNPSPTSLASAGPGNQGNIFGGCFESGIVKGNVKISVKKDLVPSDFFATGNPTRESYLDYSVAENAANLFATPLSVFGGGYGSGATVLGNATVDFSEAGGALKVFGGGYGGTVDGNTTVNFSGDSNVGKLYGGGFEGPITGNATVNLNGGTAYDVIGGACNADVEGHTEVYIGTSGFPTITNNVYGANDFGGHIGSSTTDGVKDFASNVSTTAADKVYSSEVVKASAYVEYTRGSVNYIFGGAKASYDYKNQELYAAYADENGIAINPFKKTYVGNAFVNFRPMSDTRSSVARIYGAGQGYFNERDKDLLQSNSYVLIDIPTGVENFASMEVFGAGDYSGVGMDIPAATVRANEVAATDVTAAAVIDLVRGDIYSVYGGSYKQGFTRRTIVNIPEGSTIDMNYLYGGAYGVATADGHELGNKYPCDVYESNVNFKSDLARVRTIYGGNNSYRRTLYSHVNIYKPVQYVHQTYGLTHANVFGAGYGENTWAQYTEVNLFDGAKVYEPYGGGEAGSVYNDLSIAALAGTPNNWDISIPGDYETTDASYDHGGLDNALAHSNQLYADYVTSHPDINSAENPINKVAEKYNINVAEKYNTNVHIHKGATVVNYAYGAGLGSHIATYVLQSAPIATEPQYSDYKENATSLEDLDDEAQAKYLSDHAAYETYMAYTVGAIVGEREYKSFSTAQKAQWKQTSHRTTAVVSGTSYIDLLGGIVTKDLYAAGTTGSVQDTLMIKSFTATSTAYVKGGMARNIYGGGWEGPVGKHDMSNDAADFANGTYLAKDVLGVANVIMGRPEEDIAAAYAAALNDDSSLDKGEFYFYNGVPAITRNAYAGGEGGVIRGEANLNIFNGLVGYRFKHKNDITEAEKNYYKIETDASGHITYTALVNDEGLNLSNETYLYVEEIDQDNVGDNVMYEAGNAFGGGYAANSDVDVANITLWDGIIRNSMYGGGEIATIGRGIQEKNTSTNEFEVTIYKPGETHVTMMGGHVLRDVFGGGRGFNNWKTEDKTEGNTNGYIFGRTDVNIHFGTIGTPDGVLKGYGNVFGGGNIGFVYSQYAKQDDGWYYEDYTSTPKKLSEDTRVEVKAYGKALANLTIGSASYTKGDYIPNTDLDKLKNSDSQWNKIDQTGITIYNAVFAGGNVSAGSDKIMAFSKTVYGNSTASVVDAYTRDLISVGGSGVGGLYGDGNLTFVDGYRELNLTNYGSDYFTLSKGVPTETEFNALTPRQQSFYLTQYRCTTAYGIYEVGDIIMSDLYNNMSDADKSYWTRQKSMVNEGRYINTVQRCDFCGIKGSRIVLHGAIDRAQDESEADFTNYTINRVGELSLNQNTGPGDNEIQMNHGSYFGIYNVVKFLGGVTSDVRFAGDGGAVRQTDSEGADYAPQTTGQTYYQWKQAHKTDLVRNDGTAPNKIALASGVFLEIVKDLDANGDKIYGPITGVVELDLLNVSPGEGGGYVYAKNIHGAPTYTATYADVISDANEGLVTNRAFSYANASTGDDMQTSGNFIHSLPKHILDDCFPESKSYAGQDASPAHYWYIRGEFYVYEQLVSAYTGGSDAYSTEMSIPLTMAIQGNAKLRLLNVLPGLYADPAKLTHYTYNANEPELSVSDSLSITNNAIIKTYGQGDPISYWDWYNATTAERNMFVMETDARVCNTESTFGNRTYYPGETITASVYSSLENATGVNLFGEDVKGKDVFSVINEVNKANGYLLTVDFSNPSKWDDYYRHSEDYTSTSADDPVPTDPIKKAKLQELLDACTTEAEKKALLDAYIKSATFTCNAEGTYGQYYFYEDEIISHNVYAMEAGVTGHVNPDTQADFVPAYMAKADCEVSVTVNGVGVLKSYTKGTPISATDYGNITNSSTYFEPAYICVNTVLVANGDFRVLNQLVGETEWNSWSTDVKGNFQPAYYCTQEGSWGGKWYEDGHNYNGVDYGQLLKEERQHFSFNYDALDLLYYNNYVKDEVNGAYAYNSIDDFRTFINNVGGTNRNTAISVFDEANNPLYAVSAPLDYTATFNSNGTPFVYVKNGANLTVEADVTLNNEQYESLPNDRKYYASFAVSDDHLKDKDGNTWSDGQYHTFIVMNTFDVAGTMYNAGKSITHADFYSLGPQQRPYVKEVKIPYVEDISVSPTHGAGTYYFCIEKYIPGANDANVTTSDNSAVTTPVVATPDAEGYIPVGTVIDYNTMLTIPNYQLNFDIQGEVPIEETTLYVPVSADISALQKDRYVTAIYEYTYTECDASGMNYETRVEKHILNIRIKFLSGTPVIGSIKEPDLVLPLETVGFDIPSIQEGAFPILGGGWEIYPTEDNAKRHRNGREYVNGGEPLFFYQNDYYVAYFALTRMGKTFSDPVPLHVANYQRMADVINNSHHMYINHRDNDRDPKIYIDSRSTDTYDAAIRYKDQAQVEREYSNELDAMQALWDLVNSGYGREYSEEVDGKSRNISGANGLEFFLQGEVRSQLPSWTSIGGDGSKPCFGGVFHGNGNTITGLNNSLFGSLCGSVYNLGVMGNFTKGGIANTGEGRIENAWVWTSGAPSAQAHAVYDNPGEGAVIVNCYYPEANAFTESNNPEIKQRPVEEFVNGTVAYNLNRYYLEARYRLFGDIDGTVEDKIFYRLPDGTLMKDTETLIADANGKQPGQDGYVTTYANQVYTISYPDGDYTRFRKLGSTLEQPKKLGYVEKYVDDGDFRFSDGKIPQNADLRLSSTDGYIPLYPDDYIFFGQKLTYNLLNDGNGYPIAHVTHPQAAAKQHTIGSGEDVDNSHQGLLINDVTNRNENRVYRAPAYFGNGTYGRSVMFNANAAFIKDYTYTINNTSYTSHPHAGLTAVDFTGGNGDTNGYQGVVAGLASDFKDGTGTNNYAPLLDYERLDGIRTSGITQNLLAYAPFVGSGSDSPDHSKNEQTYNVLVNYFSDLAFAEADENRSVAEQESLGIKGHVVRQTSTTVASGQYPYESGVDHFLVDKQDFNAPMAYTFAEGKRMWYQRKPTNYANNLSTATPDNHDAWETIVLPFTAELVTTQNKGEITHFYGQTAGENYTTGHEYWLRGFSGVTTENSVTTADFERIQSGDVATTSAPKVVSNTFLSDYYYSKEDSKDENGDVYQEYYKEKYYNEARSYTDYYYLTAGVPYIIAFPGSRYYEFDMSGTWAPTNTSNDLLWLENDESTPLLKAQTVTYASATGETIPVTNEAALITTKTVGNTAYTFQGTFLNGENAVVDDFYVLNADGTAFEVETDESAKLPFRAYFKKPSTSAPPRRIIIGNRDKGEEPEQPVADLLTRGLKIYGKKDAIIIESTLDYDATVVITTVSGKLIDRITVKPSSREVVPVNSRGVYIANRQKVAVL